MGVQGARNGNQTVCQRKTEDLVAARILAKGDDQLFVVAGGTEHIAHFGFQEKVDQELADDNECQQDQQDHVILAVFAESVRQAAVKKPMEVFALERKDGCGVAVFRQELGQRKVDRKQCGHHDDSRQQLGNAALDVEESRDRARRHAHEEAKEDRHDRGHPEAEHQDTATHPAQRKGSVHRQIGKVKDGIGNIQSKRKYGKAKPHLQTVDGGTEK